MKRNLIILKTKIASAVLVFFISVWFGFGFFKPEADPTTEKKITYKLTIEEKNQLKTGDIILRKGEGFVSSVINDLFETGFKLSHCAFVIREGDQINVIHTVSSELSDVDGVQSEGIDKFIRESVYHTVIVVRYKTDSLHREMMGTTAKAYLNKGITFDNKFDISDTTEFYCTELIHRVFFHVYGEDKFTERFNTDHPKFLGVDAFMDTTKFERVINHQSDYGLMPE